MIMKFYFNEWRHSVTEFERAGFSDHMVPENRTKNYFIQHFRLIQSVWPRFLLLVMGASSEIFNCLQTETSV